MDSHETLVQLCKEGYIRKIQNKLSKEVRKPYAERVKHELSVIHSLGFDDYFLIVADIISQTEKKGIRVGPGRGSAAGSLVAYCLGITKLDPIKYGLYFERFLNKDRISAPDIDIDIASSGRDWTVNYAMRKYGADRVAQVVTYAYMGTRGLVRDLCKSLGVDPVDMEDLSKLIDSSAKDLDEAAEWEPKILRYATKYPEMFDIANHLNGCISHTSKHAAGIVITKEPLIEAVPILYKSGNALTQYDKDALEECNYLKIDLLGLRNMDIIADAIKLIGKDVIEDMPMDDEECIRQFRKGNSVGTFQFETPGMRKILREVHVDKFEDLAAVNALDRPGAKQGLEFYIKGKETGQLYYFNDERLKPILEETYGTITYQEQTMAIVQAVAGFSMSKADLVRRGIAKPKPGKLEELHKEFVDGCVKNGQKAEWAEKLFKIIQQGESYSFNKAHATAYALIGYQCMYLKVHYPLEYMTALLCNWVEQAWEKGKKLDWYEKEARRIGIEILDWDINESDSLYKMDRKTNSIRRGLAAIKHVGDVGYHIAKLRPFHSFRDFFRRVNKQQVRTTAVKALIDAGCFDALENGDRKTMAEIMDISVTKGGKANFTQQSLFEE